MDLLTQFPDIGQIVSSTLTEVVTPLFGINWLTFILVIVMGVGLVVGIVKFTQRNIGSVPRKLLGGTRRKSRRYPKR